MYLGGRDRKPEPLVYHHRVPRRAAARGLGQDSASAPPGYSWQFLEHPRLQSVLQTSLSLLLSPWHRWLCTTARHSVTESYRRCFITAAQFSSHPIASPLLNTISGLQLDPTRGATSITYFQFLLNLKISNFGTVLSRVKLPTVFPIFRGYTNVSKEKKNAITFVFRATCPAFWKKRV